MAEKTKVVGLSAKETQTKVFGLSAESGRWIFVVLGLIINLCMGSVYSWSVFRKPLESLFNVGATQSALPFTVFLAFFAVSMLFAGKPLDKLGPRNLMVLGGLLVGVGWIVSRFAPNMTVLSLTYGLIAGTGVGLIYGGPIAVSTRWFPDRKGLAVGLTVLGFGISALVTAPLARVLIDASGPLNTFAILGAAFSIIIILLSLPMRFPAVDWRPKGWKPPQAASGTAAAAFNTSGMMKTVSFYGLWLCFLIGSVSGLMAIGIASPVGQEMIKLSAAVAATLVSVFAIFNGVGRPIFGWFTDKLTPRYAAVLSFAVIFLSSLGMMSAGEGSTALYILCFCGFWLSFGGWLAIAPTSTSTFFGSKYYSQIYGVVFTAYGVGAIIGNLFSGRLRDLTGSYQGVFIYTAAMAVIGIFIAVFMLRAPKKG